MCVIVYKPKNQKIPSIEILKQCFNKNPHGSGIMVARDGQVIIKKGMMTFQSFQTEFQKMNIQENECAIFHFRIATAGGIRPACCHPFPVTSSKSELEATNVTTNVGIAHNGIINIQAKDGMSDSMTFIRDIFSKSAVFDNRNKNSIRTLINSFLGNNKVIVMFPEGNVEFYGFPRDMWKKQDGCLYSNSSFRLPKEDSFEEVRSGSPAKVVTRILTKEEIANLINRKSFTKKSSPISGFVNSETICPECSRSTFLLQLNGSGKRECKFCVQSL